MAAISKDCSVSVSFNFGQSNDAVRRDRECKSGSVHIHSGTVGPCRGCVIDEWLMRVGTWFPLLSEEASRNVILGLLKRVRSHTIRSHVGSLLEAVTHRDFHMHLLHEVYMENPSMIRPSAMIYEERMAALNGSEDGNQRIPAINREIRLLLRWYGAADRWTRKNFLVLLLQRCAVNVVRHIAFLLHDKTRKRDFIRDLPKSLALHLLSFLSDKDLSSAEQVSMKWNDIIVEMRNGITFHRREEELENQYHKCYRSFFTIEFHTRAGVLMARNVEERNMYYGHYDVQAVYVPGMVNTDGSIVANERFCSCTYVQSDRRWICGGRDHMVRSRSLVDRTQETVLVGHTGSVRCIKIVEQRNEIVSAGFDTFIRRWSLSTGRSVGIFSGHTSTIYCLHVVPSRALLLSGGRDRTLRVWEYATGRERAVFSHKDSVRALAATNDGTLMASGSQDGAIKVWDVLRNHLIQNIEFAHEAAITGLSFDQGSLVSTSLDCTLKTWGQDNGAWKENHELVHPVPVTCVLFAWTRALTGATDGLMRLWNTHIGICVRTLDAHARNWTGPIRSMSAGENFLEVMMSTDTSVFLIQFEPSMQVLRETREEKIAQEAERLENAKRKEEYIRRLVLQTTLSLQGEQTIESGEIPDVNAVVGADVPVQSTLESSKNLELPSSAPATAIKNEESISSTTTNGSSESETRSDPPSHFSSVSSKVRRAVHALRDIANDRIHSESSGQNLNLSLAMSTSAMDKQENIQNAVVNALAKIEDTRETKTALSFLADDLYKSDTSSAMGLEKSSTDMLPSRRRNSVQEDEAEKLLNEGCALVLEQNESRKKGSEVVVLIHEEEDTETTVVEPEKPEESQWVLAKQRRRSSCFTRSPRRLSIRNPNVAIDRPTSPSIFDSVAGTDSSMSSLPVVGAHAASKKSNTPGMYATESAAVASVLRPKSARKTSVNEPTNIDALQWGTHSNEDDFYRNCTVIAAKTRTVNLDDSGDSVPVEKDNSSVAMNPPPVRQKKKTVRLNHRRDYYFIPQPQQTSPPKSPTTLNESSSTSPLAVASSSPSTRMISPKPVAWSEVRQLSFVGGGKHASTRPTSSKVRGQKRSRRKVITIKKKTMANDQNTEQHVADLFYI